MYVYFDWENGWATRKKSDFRFEYVYFYQIKSFDGLQLTLNFFMTRYYYLSED